MSYPQTFAAWIARGSGASPTCQAPTPAESTVRFSNPSALAIARKTPSAAGERQMFPVQTKRTAEDDSGADMGGL